MNLAMRRSVIFCYHKVGPEAEEGRFLNVEPAGLRAQLLFLRRRYWAVHVSDVATRGGQVALTFDDAYLSALTHGLEILRELNLPATFYAVPNLVGKSSEWDGERARPLADWDLLTVADEEGQRVGNHTWSHPDLSLLSLEEQMKEWESAQERLVREGLEPVSGCYPYGKGNATSAEALGRVCAWGVTLEGRPIAPTDSPLLLPRIAVAFRDRAPQLLYKVHVRPHLPPRRGTWR
jgi:peptidoglycan/xylan/chitin deacetylase (PgdA/CDA1 family)